MDELTAYHQHPAWSATQLKAAITGTMRDYWSRYEDPYRPQFQLGEAMRQGSLVDCMLLQPDRFDQRYVIAPAIDRRTKAGREAWEELQASGLEVISADWHLNAQAVCAALAATPEVAAILDHMRDTSQKPHFWQDPAYGECRYMPDVETTGGDLWDLKKTRSAEPRLAAAQAFHLAYDLQLAHYALGFEDRHGTAPQRVGLICWEWEPPHNCSVLTATPAFLELGRRRRADAIERIMRCSMANAWPSHGEALLDVPPWMRSGAATHADTIDPDSIALF